MIPIFIVQIFVLNIDNGLRNDLPYFIPILEITSLKRLRNADLII